MRRVRFLGVVGVLLAAAGSALAQGPPAMPAVTFPVDTASIVTATVTAGGVCLLAYFGPKIGFGIVKKILRRVSRSV